MKQTTRNIITNISLIASVLGFIILTLSAKVGRENQEVTDIDIYIDHTKGCFFMDEPDALAVVNQHIDTSSSMVTIRQMEELEAGLKGLPYIEDANVFLDNHGSLSVKIIQRMPVMRVYISGNGSFYVDNEGNKFPAEGKYALKLPVVNGFLRESPSFHGSIQDPALIGAHEVVKAISKDDFWKAQIAQIYINEDQDLELIPRFGNQVIEIGDPDGLREKLDKLEIFYSEAMERIGWNTYQSINLKFKDQIICTKN